MESRRFTVDSQPAEVVGVLSSVCDMSKTKIVLLTVALLASLLVGLIVFAFYDLSHKPLLSFISEEMVNVQIAFKGALGDGPPGPWSPPITARMAEIKSRDKLALL